jgi:uncharacterized protein involved in exopolysaccharide biosynthesis
MYNNPKGLNARKIIFLIITNLVLIVVVLLLASILFKWDISGFFNWIPLVQKPQKEGIVEKDVNPMIIEKSDMDKREEYLTAKEQQLNLLEKELEVKQAELKAYESELNTLRDNIEKEKILFDKQRNTYSTEEERYRATAAMLNNMDIAGAVEILSSEKIRKYEVIKILLTLNKIAAEQNKFSITPVILQEMANPDATATG